MASGAKKDVLQAKLNALGSKAIEKLEWVLENGEEDSSIIKAAEGVLDRIGYARVARQEVQQHVDLGITINHRFPAPIAHQGAIEIRHKG